jgi:hypothetical protein
LPFMSAKKNSTPVDTKKSQNLSGWFFSGSGTIILCIILIGIFIVCAYFAWQRISPKVLASPEYVLGPRQLEITPLPSWIHRDLQMEIYRDLGREGSLSIMDEGLIDRVSAAFSRHPWIAKVQQVVKQYPAKVKVDLVYRRPVCMVEVEAGLMPVDAEATLLPTTDFSPIEAAKYPRLAGVDRGPLGAVGGRWGDSRVVGGAEIAEALLPLWEKLNLQSIAPVPLPEMAAGGGVAAANARRVGEYQFIIVSRGGRRILWGHSPAGNSSGEPTLRQKVKKLEQYAAEHGSLDDPQDQKEIDLRQP